MQAGDQRAFGEFFNACAPRLAAFAARRSPLDPQSLEDLVQNTLIKAIRNLGSYRGDAALFTWTAGIALRELSDLLRKAARRPGHIGIDDPSLQSILGGMRAPESREPIAELEAAGQRASIMSVLASMPENYARALEAKYGDGLSVEAIALELDLSVTAAQSLLARARQSFRDRWQARRAHRQRLGTPGGGPLAQIAPGAAGTSRGARVGASIGFFGSMAGSTPRR
jgi:RNA polymerase sigma-70 factor (ECF subfamily)